MTAPSILLITSNHRRHRWLAGRLAEAGRLRGLIVENKPEGSPQSVDNPDAEVRAYFEGRDRAETRWFADAPSMTALDAEILAVDWGGANGPAAAAFAQRVAPDIVVLFGSCIIKDPLLGRYAGRIVNMHLGLSPYYRGSATNFWPLVDGLPECVGVTIHHAVPEVDGGAILAQARPAAASDDDSHDLGSKAVIAGADALASLIRGAGSGLAAGLRQNGKGKLCRRRDFSVGALHRMKKNFADGMMAAYIRNKPARDRLFPIHSLSPALSGEWP